MDKTCKYLDIRMISGNMFVIAGGAVLGTWSNSPHSLGADNVRIQYIMLTIMEIITHYFSYM